MEDLEIGVRTPDGVERRYRFSQFPVLVGRAPDCDISICHEAVPRHLCRVWLEDGGRLVRVEERPGLTNALSLGGRPIEGGVSGGLLRLDVGPIGLTARAAQPARRWGATAKRRRVLLLVAAVAVAAALAIAATTTTGRGASAEQILPTTLFDRRVPESFATGPSARAGNPERAALLRSRAVEVLGRRDVPMRDRVQAVRDLERAAALYAESDGGQSGAECAALAATHAGEIDRVWRRDRLALAQSLAADDAAAVSANAARLAGYLGADCAPALEYLEGLARGTGAEAPEVLP
jgi:hypothetical protein